MHSGGGTAGARCKLGLEMHRPMPINWLTRERTGQRKVGCHGHIPHGQDIISQRQVTDQIRGLCSGFQRQGRGMKRNLSSVLLEIAQGVCVRGTPYRKADPTAQAKCHTIPSSTQESGSKKSVFFVKLGFQGGLYYPPCAFLSSTATAQKSEQQPRQQDGLL